MSNDINLLPLRDYGEIDEYKREHYFLFQAFTDSKLEYKDTIEWSDCPKANGIQTMLDAVNSDYHGHLKNAITVVEKYCEHFYEEPNKIAQFIIEFSFYLNKIHPYFNAKISNFSDLCYVTPADLLFIYQIIQKMIRENNTGNPDYKKDEGYLCEMIYEAVCPIFQMICGNMTPEMEKSLFEDIEKYYNHIVHPDEFLNHELVSIFDTLESLKRLLTILANKRNKKYTIPYSMFMRLYRLGFNKDTKVNFKKEFDECEHPIFLSEFDYAVQNITDYENYDYSSLENYANVYRFFCFEQLGYFYASYLYNHNEIIIRQCENCGKFFIAEDKREKYCNNLLQDDTQHTCRQVGAIIKRDKLYGSDEFRKFNKNVQKRINTLKNNCKYDIDRYILVIIYDIWKKKYKNMPKPGSELPGYLNDMYQIFLFSFNEYKFQYHTKREDKIGNLRKNQAQKCFESIKDDHLMILPIICDIWKAKVQKSIKDSLKEIYENIVTVDKSSDLSAKVREEKTIQNPEWKSIIDSIEKTFDSIIIEYNNSIQIYEYYQKRHLNYLKMRENFNKLYKAQN